MAALNEAELNALAKAAGIDIPPELLTEVGYKLSDSDISFDNRSWKP